MARGLMVVLALAATAARAQEAKGDGSTDAATTKGAEGAITLAARTTPEPRSAPPARSAGSPDAGADAAGTTIRASATNADCSIVETFVDGGAPAIRTYQAPPPEPQGTQEQAWNQPPHVKSVARCGHRYIFQVWSRSKDLWVVERARVEGPQGDLLPVTGRQFGTLEADWSINVITAEAPPRAKFSKLKLHLSGKDDRTAQVEARDLP